MVCAVIYPRWPRRITNNLSTFRVIYHIFNQRKAILSSLKISHDANFRRIFSGTYPFGDPILGGEKCILLVPILFSFIFVFFVCSFWGKERRGNPFWAFPLFAVYVRNCGPFWVNSLSSTFHAGAIFYSYVIFLPTSREKCISKA